MARLVVVFPHAFLSPSPEVAAHICMHVDIMAKASARGISSSANSGEYSTEQWAKRTVPRTTSSFPSLRNHRRATSTCRPSVGNPEKVHSFLEGGGRCHIWPVYEVLIPHMHDRIW